ncbi:hypothetical protein GCM10010978_29410 [Compostibacillus humi]|uniref:Uncharacterized protein n=1 Tax=Compostibacillus humi TaxID=1245525 RepID=A0A8J2TRE3_9BACI|nr:hypothetical protein [Compostibacillus humi]GFZ87794.1 hypothetical protein GCM10010978_29410 [Compostibacillus humi]HLT55155.1 hypothetical protein [Bacillota bacterium]
MKIAVTGFGFAISLLLGVSIGILLDSFEAGGAIGLGAGLIIVSIFRKNRS